MSFLKDLSLAQSLLGAVGIIVLVLWGSWWVSSFRMGQLQGSPAQWFPRYHFLGLDFLHNYHAARHWLKGGDPYQEPFGDPLGRKLCYPPIVLPFFSWSLAFSPQSAVIVWTVSLAGLAGVGTVASWLVRRNLNLGFIPFPFALSAILTCAPVAYAMERGNYDLLLIPLILGAAWGLQKKTICRDVITGSCLALAACFKFYPALLIVALLPLQRVRAAVLAVVAVGLFATFQWESLPASLSNLREMAHIHSAERHVVIATSGHSLTGSWKLMWEGTRCARLGQIPGSVAALAIFGPVLAWVGDRAYRSPNVGPLALPLLLWITAVATFIPSVANDYSLVFLPLAALAVWDHRDPILVHLGMAALVIWAQPFSFEIDPAVLLGLKVISTLAVGVCLAERLRKAPATANHSGGVSICPAK